MLYEKNQYCEMHMAAKSCETHEIQREFSKTHGFWRTIHHPFNNYSTTYKLTLLWAPRCEMLNHLKSTCLVLVVRLFTFLFATRYCI